MRAIWWLERIRPWLLRSGLGPHIHGCSAKHNSQPEGSSDLLAHPRLALSSRDGRFESNLRGCWSPISPSLPRVNLCAGDSLQVGQGAVASVRPINPWLWPRAQRATSRSTRWQAPAVRSRGDHSLCWARGRAFGHANTPRLAPEPIKGQLVPLANSASSRAGH